MDIEEGKRIIKELKELPRISHSKLQSILTSIERVVKWNDIERLNIFAYRYLLLCRGWSSHSDLYSFRSVYENVNDLVKDLIDKQHLNQYENFNEGDMDYDYYKQRAEIYNAIIEMVKEYDL
jgi:hypothetical protein